MSGAGSAKRGWRCYNGTASSAPSGGTVLNFRMSTEWEAVGWAPSGFAERQAAARNTDQQRAPQARPQAAFAVGGQSEPQTPSGRRWIIGDHRSRWARLATRDVPPKQGVLVTDIRHRRRRRMWPQTIPNADLKSGDLVTEDTKSSSAIVGSSSRGLAGVSRGSPDS